MNQQYGVWAVRSAASIFGAAQSWCKQDGQPLAFDSLAAAEAYAKQLNDNRYSANVSYQARELPAGVLEQPENYLRNAELAEESQSGNYNMLDGQINNEPPVRADLTDGQTDEEIKELLPELAGRPSILEKLQEAQPENEARTHTPASQEREL